MSNGSDVRLVSPSTMWGCAFLFGVTISILSGLLLAYMYLFNLINPAIPNYHWVKFTSLFSSPEIVIPIGGFVVGTVLIVLGILLPRPKPESK